MFAKTKRVKLRGKPKHELRQAIFDRDQYCIVCGDPINNDWHHEPCGSGKSDEIEKGVRLCKKCHYKRHNGPGSAEVKRYCQIYLERLYKPRSDYVRGENLQ